MYGSKAFDIVGVFVGEGRCVEREEDAGTHGDGLENSPRSQGKQTFDRTGLLKLLLRFVSFIRIARSCYFPPIGERSRQSEFARKQRNLHCDAHVTTEIKRRHR